MHLLSWLHYWQHKRFFGGLRSGVSHVVCILVEFNQLINDTKEYIHSPDVLFA